MNELAELQIKDIEASVISDEERELAQNALSEFQSGAYTSCSKYLEKLESLRPKDLKVMHNKVVTEYYKNDLKKIIILRKSLNAICGQLSNIEASDAADDVEKCVMRYNQAILMYHTKQFYTALHIVSRLFSLIEPLVSEESLAQKVCLLLVELYIAIAQPDTALALVNHIERQFAVSELPKVSSTDKEGVLKSIKEQNEPTRDSSDIVNDVFRMTLLKYRIKIYLMTHQSKLCEKEWETLVTMGTNMNISNIFLAANKDYSRGKCKKAMILLNTITLEQRKFKICGESAAVLYYNNVACIHHALGKPNLACFYLQKALEEHEQAIQSVQVEDSDPMSSQPLCNLGGNKYYDLIYNLGVCYLYTGRNIKAFDCFVKASQRLHNSPRLWLRVAECCISNNNQPNEVNLNILKGRQDLVRKVIVSGLHKKIILSSPLCSEFKYHSGGLSYSIPQPTLEFAMLCLKNAYYLMNNNSVLVPKFSIGQHATQISPSTAIEALNLKMSIFATSAYVSLCIGDYNVALEHAKNLLSMDNLPGAYTLLGKLYAAESLISLDKIDEAINYLRPDALSDLDISVPIPETFDKDEKTNEEINKNPIKGWYPTNVLTGKAILLYNMAVAYAIRGQLDKSGEIVGQLWKSKGTDYDVPVHVIMLALYIELKLGRIDKWRSIIKRNCPQQFK